MAYFMSRHLAQQVGYKNNSIKGITENKVLCGGKEVDWEYSQNKYHEV